MDTEKGERLQSNLKSDETMSTAYWVEGRTTVYGCAVAGWQWHTED